MAEALARQPPEIGQRAERRQTFTDADVEAYPALSGDRNPLHFTDEFVAGRVVGRRIVRGGLTTGLFNAIVAEQLRGPGSVILHQEWDYPEPVFIGDTVTAVLRGESAVYTLARPV